MKDSELFRAAAAGLLAGVALAWTMGVVFPSQRLVAAKKTRPALASLGVPAPVLEAAARPAPKALQHLLDVEKVAWGPRTPHHLIRRRLLMPVEGVSRARLTDSFFEPRPGDKRHEAIDIRAARGTPVLAVEDAVVRRIKWHERGGLTVYLYDSSGTYSYYFAHLAKLAPGLEPGCMVSRGEVIGYVGSTGSAAGGFAASAFRGQTLGPTGRLVGRRAAQSLPRPPGGRRAPPARRLVGTRRLD